MARWVCEKEVCKTEIPSMQERTSLLMANLEKVFPPSFFDMQAHLIAHLVDEVAVCGTVHGRWMYWVERFMGTLKNWVHQRAQPEGNIGYNILNNGGSILIRRSNWQLRHQCTNNMGRGTR